MRGASALGALLRKYPEADVAVFVVWLPVVLTDAEKRGRPSKEVARSLVDRRVRLYWDPGGWLSGEMLRAARARPDGFPPHGRPPDDMDVLWDAVAIFPPGVVWSDPFPTPASIEGPILDVLAPVEKLLADASPAREGIR